MTHLRCTAVLIVAGFSGAALHAQAFQNSSASIPATGSQTSSVDFADVDHDGDLDVVVGDGGGDGFSGTDDQNRLWINQGGLQGGTIGTFIDETLARMPAIADLTNDVEFVDYDRDGDPDIHVSNSSDLLNEACLFLTNMGGAQGGTPGYFVNETAARWLGLGQPGSSVNPGAVLPSGGFIDWTMDSDFADIDDDGALDLVHTSRGGAFSGNSPTRLFTNDGAGHYTEFNPVGHSTLWADAPAVITTSCLGVEVADLDADYDPDIVLGSRSEAPRLFRANVTTPGVGAPFTDITSTGFPPGYWSGSNNYEQEFSDLDNDSDLELWGVNWPALNDAVFQNTSTPGSPQYSGMTTIPSSGDDDNDIEIGDLDGDSKPDACLLGKGARKNTWNGVVGQYSFAPTSTAYWGMPTNVFELQDAAFGDVDANGTTDVLQAHAGGDERLWTSTLASGDVYAPKLPRFTQLGGHVAGTSGLVLHAHVFDDTSIAQWPLMQTRVQVGVDGFELGELACVPLAGPSWRVNIHDNLVGQVSYSFEATDRAGNTGVSSSHAFASTTALAFASPFGAGSAGSLGVPQVHALSVPFANRSLFLGGSNAPASTPGFLVIGDAAAPSAPLALPGLCNVNAFGNLLLFKSVTTDANGRATAAVFVPPSAPAGIHVYAQFFALDGTGGNLLSSSAGLDIVTQ
jgi:hypothetical protein